MMSRGRWAARTALLSTGALIACAPPRPEPFPHPTVSRPPQPTTADHLQAGIGRADITPPPGVGLMGYGPEGKRAAGYRQRLFARAIVLEDADGERLALVALDLPATSLLLHRTVARAVLAATGIGADRLVMSATHTHAGPGHYFGMRSYNELGSSVAGFDREMADFLAKRITRAVLQAAGELRDARIAWGEVAVWNATRNRSLGPFGRNPKSWQRRFPRPSTLPPVPGHVDSTLAMLRLDLRDPGSGEFRPEGAFSVFAIHPNGNPGSNDLLDADITGIMSRRLERHIDGLNGKPSGFRPDAVHLVTVGAQGDVAADMPLESMCHYPDLQRVRRPSGPRSPPGPELWIPPPEAEEATCLARGREWINAIGDRLGAAAIRLFDSLGPRLSGDIEVRRAFRTVTLPEPGRVDGLCEPRVGTATLVGSSDRATRHLNHRLFGTKEVGLSQGGAAAIDTPEGCHAQKRLFLGKAQKLLVQHLPLSEIAQLSVFRVGDVLVGTTPFEVTTVSGGRVREAMFDAAVASGDTDPTVFLVGLTNGYNQYMATAEEYELQHYEGASTLYGPNTQARIAEYMAELTREIPQGSSPSPRAVVPQIEGVTGDDKEIFPPSDAGPPPHRVRRKVRAIWESGTLTIRWNDVYPGRLVPADGPVLRVDARTGSGWTPIAWDDDRHLVVRATGPSGGDGYGWESRWTPPAKPTTPVRVVLLARRGLATEYSAVITP